MDGDALQNHKITSFSTEQEIGFKDLCAAKTVKHEKKDEHGGDLDKPHEDRMLFAPEDHAFAVFDGLGAHGGGDTTAQFARDYVADIVKQTPVDISVEETANYLKTRTLELNAHLFEETTGYTTMLLAYIYESKTGEKHLLVVPIGDCRMYLLRDGKLTCLTIDNETPSTNKEKQQEIQNKISNVQTEEELVNLSPEEKTAFQKRNDVDQALGKEVVTPIVQTHEIKANDIFLMTSDGITNNLTDKQIETTIATGNSPKELVATLINEARKIANDSANLRHIPDDMTAILFKINNEFPKRTPYTAPEVESETWINVIPEMITSHKETIDSLEKDLARKLTPSELFYITSFGDRKFIEHVEPLYRSLTRARANPITSANIKLLKQLEKSEEANPDDFLKLEQMASMSSVKIASYEDLEVYMVLQKVPEATRVALRNFYNTKQTNEAKPINTKTVLLMTFSTNASGETLPQLSSSYEPLTDMHEEENK